MYRWLGDILAAPLFDVRRRLGRLRTSCSEIGDRHSSTSRLYGVVQGNRERGRYNSPNTCRYAGNLSLTGLVDSCCRIADCCRRDMGRPDKSRRSGDGAPNCRVQHDAGHDRAWRVFDGREAVRKETYRQLKALVLVADASPEVESLDYSDESSSFYSD